MRIQKCSNPEIFAFLLLKVFSNLLMVLAKISSIYVAKPINEEKISICYIGHILYLLIKLKKLTLSYFPLILVIISRF